MKFCAKKVDCVLPLTIFAKHSILGVSQGYECVSDETKKIPDALLFISPENRTAITAEFFHF